MHYELSNELSCCDVDGQLVFLDIAQDRYFRLTEALESALRRLFAEGHISADQRCALVANGIPVDTDAEAWTPQANIPLPRISAIEGAFAAANRSPGVAAILEVAVTVWSIHRQLKSRALKAIIEDAIAYRSARMDELAAESEFSIENVLSAASQFAIARRHVPIEPRCLLDSLSLHRFLSRRRMPTTIVFGVTLMPFAAHCWVQAGDIVLNETLADAHAHTPIRAI